MRFSFVLLLVLAVANTAAQDDAHCRDPNTPHMDWVNAGCDVLGGAKPSAIDQTDLTEALLRLLQQNQLTVLPAAKPNEETRGHVLPGVAHGGGAAQQQVGGRQSALKRRASFSTSTLIMACVCSFCTGVSLCLFFVRLVSISTTGWVGGSDCGTEIADESDEGDEDHHEQRLLSDPKETERPDDIISRLQEVGGMALRVAKTLKTQTGGEREAGQFQTVQRNRQLDSHDRFEEASEKEAVPYEDERDDMSVLSNEAIAVSQEMERKQREVARRSNLPESRARHQFYASQFEEIFGRLRDGMERKAAEDVGKCVRELCDSFETLHKEFEFKTVDRYCTLNACGRVVMDLQGLDLLRDSKDVSLETAEMAQGLIEKIVPIIWN